MIEEQHYGWAIAVTAYRNTPMQYEFGTRAYGVGTDHEEDAIEYARVQSEKLWPPAHGWKLQIATLRLTYPAPAEDAR